MTSDWFTKLIGNRGVRTWSYRTSFFIFMTLFIGFASVVPIDSISQASQSDNNYALNTFVVVGALVLFGITASVISITRVYLLRTALADIPKRYVPIEPNDLPRGCSEMIQDNITRCEEVRTRALQTPGVAKHPGLSGPDSELLPPLLKFDDAVRSIGMKLKWDKNFPGSELTVPENMSFREAIAYSQTKVPSSNPELCRQYVELYEELRYSGKLITEEQFVSFMQLCIDFMEEITVKSEGEHGERFRYAASVYSRYSDVASRYSFRHRGSASHQHSSSLQAPSRAFMAMQENSSNSHSNSNSNSNYNENHNDDHSVRRVITGDSVRRTITGNSSVRRINTSGGESDVSAHSTGTTNYNPFMN